MKHYLTVWVFVGLALFLLGAIALSEFGAWRLEVGRTRTLEIRNQEALGRRHSCEARLAEARLRSVGMAEFLEAWGPSLATAGTGREMAVQLRSGLENLAQKKLGLVTDQVTSPEAGKVRCGSLVLETQRVSLRVSGEDVTSLLSWLGEAEAAYPLARVDQWEMSSSPGANISMKISITHPLAGQNRKLFDEHRTY